VPIFFGDIAAQVRDVIGGRAASYEKLLEDGRQHVIMELMTKAYAKKANAVVGTRVDCEVLGAQNGMLMITALGTAVIIQRDDKQAKEETAAS
jgi:uncharacterized protein YbjQ (UPF0145 family)